MKTTIAAIAASVAFAATSIAAMITHIIVCIHAAAWGLLIAGALLPFIGIIHGVGCWFKAW
jgi:hypothetical protein